MTAFHVYINGELRFRAGCPDEGSLVAAVTHLCCRNPDGSVLLQRMCVNAQASEPSGEQAHWAPFDLSAGDEVTIKLAEGGEMDEPRFRHAPPSAGLSPPADDPARIPEFYRSVYGDPEELPDDV